MAVEVLNRQRRQRFDAAALGGVVEAALAAAGCSGDVTVLIGNDSRLRTLNRIYRGKDRPTDVLSFEYAGVDGALGDIVISVDRALEQASAAGHSLQRELELLALHGALHVCGYDHETDHGEMNRVERRLRRRLGLE
jgi:probable rRNA maturation factor